MSIAPVSNVEALSAEAATMAAEIESALNGHSLSCWFPRCIDDHGGGFLQNFDRDWTHTPDVSKSLVFQSRMTWVTATVARRRSEYAEYRHWATRGVEFLEASFWDSEYGGLWFRSAEEPEKHSYGIAFAIFAAAACYRLTGDEFVLSFATRVLEWWDSCAHDDQACGYFETLSRDGSPVQSHPDRRLDVISTPYGQRSSNTLLHIIEALTELYFAHPTTHVSRRLEEVLGLLEDVLLRHSGRLYKFYDRNWKVTDRTVSFGHDVEAAYLADRARRALGWNRESPAENLAERALRDGTDRRWGGMYLERRAYRLSQPKKKVWWVQAEALNTLILLHERHHESTMRHFELLQKYWSFVRSCQLDRRYSGWLDEVSRDGTQVVQARKGHAWKACYHEVRALLNVVDGLRAVYTTHEERDRTPD